MCLALLGGTVGSTLGGMQPAVADTPSESEAWTVASHAVRDSGGLWTASVFQTPEFRSTPAGWQPIDPTLAASGDAVTPWAAAGAFRPVTIGADASRLARLDLDGGPVTLSGVGIAASAPTLDGNGVLFTGVAPATDLRVRVEHDRLRTELVLGSSAAPSVFRFHLSDPSGALGSLVSDGNGAYHFSTLVDGATLRLAPSTALGADPTPEDGINGYSASAATQVVVPAGDGYDITEALTPAFLATAVWPVTLDPDMVLTVNSGSGYSEVDCRIIDGSYADTGFCPDTFAEWGMAGGYTRRTLLNFPLSGLPSNASVTDASLQFYVSGTQGTAAALDSSARSVCQAWGSPTWNNADPGTAWTRVGGCPNFTTYDRHDVGPAVGWDAFNVTTIVQDARTTPANYHGFELVHDATGTVIQFKTSESPTTSQRPKLVISYRTTPTAPAAPTASPGNGQATVSWTAPSDGGSAITGYTVTATPGGASATVGGSTLSGTVTGLTNGTSYTFKVHATNAIGAGPDSAASSAVVPHTVPGAPTGVTATPGNTTALVSWTAPASNGGAAITGYTVVPSQGEAFTTTGATSTTVTGLTNGTSYTFSVFADNGGAPGGPGPFSAPSAPITPHTVPGAPSSVTATAGNASAALTWAAPSNTGGSPITGYTATASPGGATATTSGATNVTVTGLVNGVSYTFTVVATNGAAPGGPGPASAPSNSVTPAPVPDAPGSVSAVPGNAQAVVSWTVPASNGSPITAYTATATPGSASATVASTATSATITGLANCTSYTFVVHASNAIGNGPDSAPTAAVVPRTVPGMPTGVSASPGNGSAAVSWTAPASNGCATITGYTVTASPGGATASTTGATNVTVTGLTNGTNYTFTVHATNAAGGGSESAASGPAAPRTVPVAPTGVTAVPGNTTAAVSWTAPSDNGGATISGYTVTASPGSATATTTGATSTTVAGLTNGTSYTFTVHATNAAGNTVESAASAATTPRTTPGAPTNVTATAGDSSAAVSWTAPASNGGSPLTGYTVTASPGGATQTVSATTTVATVSGLTNGASYTFTVHATNIAGNSAESTASSPIIVRTVPGAPTGVTATPGNASATVNWTAPASSGGAAITGYTVTASPGGATQTVNQFNSAATVSGLTNGTSYTFTVHATNAAGNSAESAASPSVIPGPPDPPTDVSASGGEAVIEVDWAAPANEAQVDSYRAEILRSSDNSVAVTQDCDSECRASSFVGVAPGDYYAQVRSHSIVGYSTPALSAITSVQADSGAPVTFSAEYPGAGDVITAVPEGPQADTTNVDSIDCHDPTICPNPSPKCKHLVVTQYAGPSSPSSSSGKNEYQVVYFFPSDYHGTGTMQSTDTDTFSPFVCDDGTFTESRLGYSARNGQAWMSAQSKTGGKSYRFRMRTAYTYNHAYKVFDVLVVKGQLTTAQYTAGNSDAVALRIFRELYARGVYHSNMRYAVYAEFTGPTTGASTAPSSASVNPGDKAPHYSVVYRKGNSYKRPVRFGCGDYGDQAMLHELTHQQGAVPYSSSSHYSSANGGHHVIDPTNDLMHGTNESTFTGKHGDGSSTQVTQWDKWNLYTNALNSAWIQTGVRPGLRSNCASQPGYL